MRERLMVSRMGRATGVLPCFVAGPPTSKPRLRLAVMVGLGLILSVPSVWGRSFRPAMLPNGNTYGCATCHVSSGGGGSRNPFGLAVEAVIGGSSAAVPFWSAALAAMDSDGDGRTNGDELNDPDGDGTASGGVGATNPGRPLMISVQPVGQTVDEGDTVEFVVGASGTAPLTYRWRKGTDFISGATDVRLTLVGVGVEEAGEYSVVVVGNLTGSITSVVATLTVNAAAVLPTITLQPVSQAVAEGGTVTLEVTAEGSEPLGYRWLIGEVEVEGAVNPTLVLNPVTVQQAGSYRVEVSNGAGTVTSEPAVVSVGVSAMLIRDPASGGVILQFPAASGVSYLVDFADDLSGGDWTSEGPAVATADGVLSITNSVSGTAVRFYQIRAP